MLTQGTKKRDISFLNKQATLVRIEILKMLTIAGSGHTGGSLSAADIVTALYFSKMRHKPDDPGWRERDRFILSKGHAAPLLYAVLAMAGYFDISALRTPRKLGSTVVEVAGAKYPGASKESPIPPLDGVSLVPAFQGQAIARQKPLFFQFNEGSAVRDGRWKLVRSGPKWELYDLHKDRTETRVLAAERPELVQQMGAQWLAWWKDCKGTDWTGKAPNDKRKRD